MAEMNLSINPNIKLSDFEGKTVRLCWVACLPSGTKMYALKSDGTVLATCLEDTDELIALANNPGLQLKLTSNEVHAEWWI